MAKTSDGGTPRRDPGRVRLRRGMATFRPLLPVSLGVFCVSMAVHFRTPVLAEIGQDLGMSAVSLGFITTTFGFGRLTADLPAGYLNDRFGASRMYLGAGLLMAFGSLLFATAPAPAWVLVAAFGLGTASAVSNTSGMAFFSIATDSRHRGKAMAVFSASLLVGQALGPAISGGVASLTGTWRTSFWVAAALAVLVVVAVAKAALSRRAPAAGAPPASAPSAGPPSAGPPSGPADLSEGARAIHDPEGGDTPVRASRGSVRRLTRLQQLSVYAVPFSSAFTRASVPQTLVPIIGTVELGFSAAFIGAALGLAAILRVAGSFLGGYLADNRARKQALVPALFLQAGAVALIAVHGAGPWVVAIMLLSLASFTGPIGATLLADGAGPEGAGKRFGAYRFVGDLGVIIGPLLTAYCYEQFGAAGAIVPATGLLALSGLWIGLVVPETHQRHRQ